MARITIEDCLQHTPNRFKLVAMASKRARQLALGGEPLVTSKRNEKPTVLALRELASKEIKERLEQIEDAPV